MEFSRKWSEDKTERKTQGAVAAVEYNPADSCAAVRVDIAIGNRLGDISNSLLVAEIKENTGNIDSHANHCTYIKRIEFLMDTFLVEIAESYFVLLSP